MNNKRKMKKKKNKRFGDTQRYEGYAHIEERPSEDTARRWPSISQTKGNC
jgi:hypothetical protein